MLVDWISERIIIMFHNIEWQKLCVFIGAGASIASPSSLPSFRQLNNELINCLLMDVKDNDILALANLAQSINIKPEYLLQIIWNYTDGNFNPIKSFNIAIPNINHLHIAYLHSKGVRFFITTNFDKCIEKAFDMLKITYKLFSHNPNDKTGVENIITALQKRETIIWKPHGDCTDPKTLCFTMTNVAKMLNSKELKSIFNYTTMNYDILFLGYSGYDDDIFPLLTEGYKKSKNIIFWNSYQQPLDDEPCMQLKKIDSGRMDIYIGEMLNVIRKFFSCVLPSEYNLPEINTGFNWKGQIKTEYSQLYLSTRLCILARFLYGNRYTNEAVLIWEYIDKLPTEQVTELDKLRISFNLKKIDSVTTFETAINKKYYELAEIAMHSAIAFNIGNQNFQEAKYQLNKYSNCVKKEYPFFSIGRQSYWTYRIFDYEHKNIANAKNEIKKKNEIAYLELMNQGLITEAIVCLTNWAGQCAENNDVSTEQLQELIQKANVLMAYNLGWELADIYYTIANYAIRLKQLKIAIEYNEKSINLILYTKAYNQDDKEHDEELLAYLYHQQGMIKDTFIERTSLLIEAAKHAEQANSEIRPYLLGVIYSTFCGTNIDNNNLKDAIYYGTLALGYHKEANDKRGSARTLTHFGELEYKQGNKKEAYNYYKLAYMGLLEVGESLTTFYNSLSRSGITMREFKKHIM